MVKAKELHSKRLLGHGSIPVTIVVVVALVVDAPDDFWIPRSSARVESRADEGSRVEVAVDRYHGHCQWSPRASPPGESFRKDKDTVNRTTTKSGTNAFGK